MKKQGVTFFVLRALARQLQNQADFLFRLVGEEERPGAYGGSSAKKTTTIKQGSRREQSLSSPETENPPVHWLAKRDSGGAPAHWLKHVQQATQKMQAGQAPISHSHTLPIRQAPTNKQGIANRSDTSIPMRTTLPSPDTQYMPIPWPISEAISTTEEGGQLPEMEDTGILLSQFEELEIDAVAPTKGRNEADTAYLALESLSNNTPLWRGEISPGRSLPVAPAPTRSLVSARHASISRLIPSQTKAREFAATQNIVPRPLQEKGSAPTLQPEVIGASGVHNAIEKTTPITGSAPQDTDQPSVHWPRYARQIMPTLLSGKEQGSSNIDPPSLLAQTHDGGWWSAEERGHTHNPEHTSQPEVDAPLATQEKWPDLLARPGFSSGGAAPGACTPASASQTFWPALHISPSNNHHRSADRPDDQSQAETFWPTLPNEKLSSEWGWGRTRQAWEHQQRLDAEQRGNIWNA